MLTFYCSRSLAVAVLAWLEKVLSCAEHVNNCVALPTTPQPCPNPPLFQASAWRELEGVRVCSWTSPPDAVRKAQRLREMEAARLRCMSATSPKIREQVIVTLLGTLPHAIMHKPYGSGLCRVASWVVCAAVIKFGLPTGGTVSETTNSAVVL